MARKVRQPRDGRPWEGRDEKQYGSKRLAGGKRPRAWGPMEKKEDDNPKPQKVPRKSVPAPINLHDATRSVLQQAHALSLKIRERLGSVVMVVAASPPEMKLKHLWKRGVDGPLCGEDDAPISGTWQHLECPQLKAVNIELPNKELHEVSEFKDLLEAMVVIWRMLDEEPEQDCFGAAAQVHDLLEDLHTEMFARVIPFVQPDIQQSLYLTECSCVNGCWFCDDCVGESKITEQLALCADGPCTLEDFEVDCIKGTLTLELENVPVGHPPVAKGPVVFSSDATGKVTFELRPQPRLKDLLDPSDVQEIAQDLGRLHWNLKGVNVV